MVRKEFEKVNISKQTYIQLRHVSKVTGLSMCKILENIIEGLFCLSVNYDKASFQCYDSQLEQTVYVKLIGYSKLKMGKFQMSSDATEQEIDKKLTEETKKAFGES